MTDREPAPEAEDLAIARALHVPDANDPGGAPVDEHLVAEYEDVLALVAPERTPPAELEARVIGAALQARPARTTTLATARERRAGREARAATPARRRLVVLAAAAAVALAVGIAGVVASQSGDEDEVPLVGDVERIGDIDDALIDAALADPEAQRFTMRTPAGEQRGLAVVAPEGDRHVLFLYDLRLDAPAPGSTYWIWLSTPSGPIAVGDIGDAPTEAQIYVRGPFGEPFITTEDAGTEPAQPGSLVLRGAPVSES